MRQLDYKMVQGVNQVVQMSPQAAAAQGTGLARIGQALAQTGQDVSKIMLETQRANDEAIIAKAKNKWLDEEVLWQDKINTDPQNPLKWGEYRDSGFERLQQFNSTLDVSNAGRQKLEAEWTNWRSAASRNVDRLSQKKVFNNNISNSLALRDRLIEQGNFAEARRVVSGISGQLDESVAMKLSDHLDKAEANFTLNEGLADDAIQMGDDLASGKYNHLFKSKADKKEWTRKADIASRNLEVDQFSDIIEGVMLGEIDDVAEIEDTIHPKTSQASRAKYRKFLADFKDGQLQQRIKTPEYQRNLEGRLFSMIESYDSNSTNFDEQKANFMREVSKVEDEASRNEFKAAFTRKENREEVWSSAADKVVSQAIKDGVLVEPKLEPVKVTYHEYIVDGNLSKKKLSALTNLSSSQIKKIQKDISNGESKEAIKKYGIYMRRLGRDMFKKPISQLTQWEKDFYYNLTQENAPSLGSVSHTHMGDAERRDNFRREQEKHDARVNLINSELKLFFGDKKNLNEREVNEKFRELNLFFTPEFTEELLDEERRKRISKKKLSVSHTPESHKPSLAQRKKNWESGGVYISLDTNWAEGVEATQPLVVVPDDASEDMINAASKYASEMAKVHRDEFGRTDFKPRVVTRSENGRGSDYVMHLEGFAITDKTAVNFFKTPRGHALHRNILDEAFGNLAGATIGLPHSETDTGAVSDGLSEVDLAKFLLSDYKRDTRLAQN